MKMDSSWLRFHFSLICLKNTHWWGLAALLSSVALRTIQFGKSKEKGLKGFFLNNFLWYFSFNSFLNQSISSTVLLSWCYGWRMKLPCVCVCLFVSVSVGYEYESCPGVIHWERRTALMQGFELVPSSLGGWSLDKHHALNIRSGEDNTPRNSDSTQKNNRFTFACISFVLEKLTIFKKHKMNYDIFEYMYTSVYSLYICICIF